MKRPEPIHVQPLFREVREALISLLEGLAPAEWEKPTVCAQWSVKDVAAHLLGGDVGILSRRRDAFTPAGKPPANYAELIALINSLNKMWVEAVRRMSPRVLCDLLRFTGPQAEEYFSSLDPSATGTPVDWAGPGPAPVWLDLAREYTERWHHQQQIRDAVGKPGLKERRFFAPVLDAFVRALPHTYRNVVVKDGVAVELVISGDAGGKWFLVREGGEWNLYLDAGAAAAARIWIDQEDAWRLFTKGLRPQDVHDRVVLEGDARLASAALEMISVLA